MRLKKWVKVLLTIITITLSIVVYINSQELGVAAQKSNINLVLCLSSWTWLFLGQFIALNIIWNK